MSTRRSLRFRDTSVRSLAALNSSASSSRVLNLSVVYKRCHALEGHSRAPMFENRILNRSIVLKHRLRPHELDEFSAATTATKVIFPMDHNDLRTGGYALFVGQPGWTQTLADHLGVSVSSLERDVHVLEALDRIPSFDPFLLREYLRESDVDVDPCYFSISDADAERMFRFAQTEVQQLVSKAFGGMAVRSTESSRLVTKLLNMGADTDVDLLREALRLDRATYREGLFSWKGFLYYKWNLEAHRGHVQRVAREVSKIKPTDVCSGAVTAEIEELKRRVLTGIRVKLRRAEHSLEAYDEAYARLVQHSDAKYFRTFLMEAPGVFREVGEHLSSVLHVVSFWDYRFPRKDALWAPSQDLIDILKEFEGSLLPAYAI